MEYSSTRSGGTPSVHVFLREAHALLGVGAVYWLRLQPLARAEVARWRLRANAIPDEAVRTQALGKLSSEALNPEAAALFAVLAPRDERRRVAVFIVAFQVLYDYLDALNEMPGRTDVPTGLRLHRALTDALESGGGPVNAHRDHGGNNDGGYVDALVAECRRALGDLSPPTSRLLFAAAARCGEAQSHNHAYLASAGESLVEWSCSQAPPEAMYEWWELAAGGISCLAVHALVACAVHAQTPVAELSCVERAYFPSICALSALLDSLADLDEDAGSENHSFVSHYRDGEHAAGRLVAIAAEASARLAVLPNAARHKVILVGICTYYLSFGSVTAGFPAPARRSLLQHVGWLGAPMLAVMRVRRRLHARHV